MYSWLVTSTGRALRISFYLDWQINNSIFNGPIMMQTQILVHRWEQGFQCCFADGLNQSLVSSAAQATWQHVNFNGTVCTNNRMSKFLHLTLSWTAKSFERYLFVEGLKETISAKINCSSPSGVRTRAATYNKKIKQTSTIWH